MPKAVELPDHVPDHARCAYCACTHSTSLSNRGQIVINCAAHGELARWNVQSKTFVVPLKHIGSVEIARPARVPPSPQRAGRLFGGGRQNALHDLLQRNDAHPRGDLGDRPGTVRLVFTNLDNVAHSTTCTLSGTYFGLDSLSRDELRAISFDDIIVTSLEIHLHGGWQSLGLDVRIDIGGKTNFVELRASAKAFPFRYARDMAAAFNHYETCFLADQATLLTTAFSLAFGKLPFDTCSDNFFEALDVWNHLSPNAKAEFKQAPRTEEWLWTRAVQQAAESKRLAAIHAVKREIIPPAAHSRTRQNGIKAEPRPPSGPPRRKSRASGDLIIEIMDDGSEKRTRDLIDLTDD
ncbi:hypothetical protein EXIGLDRAFT_701822 [Exidia glandulosa HHB12029]|uniref:Uncharacterized protein n=1 Tax=Exidia glandulosa HHB12029 TaxID=1314781 RepID=A0A165CVE7_EXIGL|nr:hypothetical protein EXIGLDRAFT_701822 [Exidia glandulosa HHB12029]